MGLAQVLRRQKQRRRAAVSLAIKHGGLPKSTGPKGPATQPQKSKEQIQVQRSAQQARRKSNGSDRGRRIQVLANLCGWYAPFIGMGEDSEFDKAYREYYDLAGQSEDGRGGDEVRLQ